MLIYSNQTVWLWLPAAALINISVFIQIRVASMGVCQPRIAKELGNRIVICRNPRFKSLSWFYFGFGRKGSYCLPCGEKNHIFCDLNCCWVSQCQDLNRVCSLICKVGVILNCCTKMCWIISSCRVFWDWIALSRRR